jgi:membrane fusion protein, copper/silver efflux system
MKQLLNSRVFVAITVLALGLFLGWLWFSPSGESNSKSHDHQAESKEQIWTCSMHPQIRQPEAGQCPICGMDLIPLEDGGGVENPLAITMSETAMQLANVSTQIVGKISPIKSIRLNGKIQADERLIVSQSSHIPGRVEKLMINFTGEYVKRGQIIAYVYSPELVTAQKELLEAKKLEAQPQLFQAAKDKLKNWKLTDAQINQIIESDKVIEQFPIVADASGYVMSKKTNLGDYLSKGLVIYEIIDLSKVWALFDVYETDMQWIMKGDKVKFYIQSLPGYEHEGRIDFIDPVIDPKTRVAKARIELVNKDNVLKPEMFITGLVEAKLPVKSTAVVVPKSAVMWTGKRSAVYIKSSSDQGIQFVMREVTLGPGLGDSYVIESGLEEGEEIAVNGTFSIDAAAQLAGKPSMMSPSTEKITDNTKTTIGQKAKDALTPVYEAYFEFKNSLTKDDFSKSQKAGVNLKAAASKVNMTLFSGESHSKWMQYNSALEKALMHVEHVSEIEELRKIFQSVSITMISMTQSFIPLKQTVFVQHCPMADNNKGADWLSNEEEVKNPYFGSAMLTCGEVTSVIK